MVRPTWLPFVQRRGELWLLYQQAEQFKTRPSELVGLSDKYERYCFDEACYLWGKYIESEIDTVKEKHHKKKNLNKLVQERLKAILHPLDIEKAKEEADKPKPVAKGKFAEPPVGAIKKRSEL